MKVVRKFLWLVVLFLTNVCSTFASEPDSICMITTASGQVYTRISKNFSFYSGFRSIKVVGPMDAFDDFYVLEMLNKTTSGHLRVLDISEAQIVNVVHNGTNYRDNTLTLYEFDGYNLDVLYLPKCLRKIYKGAFGNVVIDQMWLALSDSLLIEDHDNLNKIKINVIASEQIPSRQIDYFQFDKSEIFVPKNCKGAYEYEAKRYGKDNCTFKEYRKYEKTTDRPTISFDETTKQITMTCSTPNAKIYYNINEDDIFIAQDSANCLEYVSPIVLSENCTIKAMAVCDEQDYSDIVTNKVTTFICEAPEIVVEDGSNTGKLKVTMSTQTPGANIYYTLNNYSYSFYSEPFFIDKNCDIKALALQTSWAMSDVSSVTIKRKTCNEPAITWTNNRVSLDVSPSGESDCIIYYTLDGSEPNRKSNIYTGPFEFKGGVLKVLATSYDCWDSSVGSFCKIVWPQDFEEVVVGDKVKLELEKTGNIKISFRCVSGDGYVQQNISRIGNDWYVEFINEGPTLLEAYVDNFEPVQKEFNVLPNPNLMKIDGILYKYTDDTKSALSVVYGYNGGDVVIPSTAGGLPVVSIGNRAFYSNAGLTSVTLPEGLKRIESDQAFGNCSNLTKIVLPSTLTYIGSFAFNVDKGLKDIYCNMIDPSQLEIFGGESILNGFVDYENCILHVPYGCAQVYREAEVWKNFKNIVEGEKEPVPVTSVQFEEEKIVLTEGDAETLQVTVLPDDADNKDVAWSSSDNSVVTVNEEGVVEAVSGGTATITAAAVDGSGVKATCTVEVISKGDSNSDGNVTVTDAVNTANYAVGKQVAVFDVKAADVNSDDVITMADASGTISIVLEQPVVENGTLVMAARAAGVTGDRLVAEDYSLRRGEKGVVNITLDNLTDYVALQADIVMPDGLTLENVRLGARAEATHTLSMRKVADNVARVVIFSAGNKAFVNNGEPLLKLYVKAEEASTDDITLQRILAADAVANEYELSYSGGHNALTSSIGGIGNGSVSVKPSSGGLHISNAKGMAVSVYHFDGSLRASFEALSDDERLSLPSGVYIVKVGSMTTKVVIK